MTPTGRIFADFRAAHPDPADALAHTLSIYAATPADEFIVVASSNVYGKDIRTGLTWGDLRRIAAQLARP